MSVKHTLSFAVLLPRIFDSGAARSPALFYAGTRRLCPLEKGGGLYVFLGETPAVLRVCCRGYQEETISPTPGETVFLPLYPAPGYFAPEGWTSKACCAPPGTLLFFADNRYEMRLLSYDTAAHTARLRTRPGLCGGTVCFLAEGKQTLALILEKRPPDLYALKPLYGGTAAGAVQRIYTARADKAGCALLVVPSQLDFTDTAVQCAGRGDAESDLAL